MFVWASVMTMMLVAPSLPLPVMLVFGVPGAIVALFAIGTAQWLELRHHVVRARAWIMWTALAWLVALPLSFLPAPLVDATTPFAVHVALWTAGGFLMALVMALVTWQGVRRLDQREP